ncbi:MAG: Crp/Fnr family transcriptional regulator [Candidatus Velthaea sp.]
MTQASAEAARENKVWYLRKSKIFEKVDDTVLHACDHLFDVRTYPKNTMLFDIGDDSRTVYLLKKGRVRIGRLTDEGKEITVAMLGEGDIFGEEVLFGTADRTTIATCLEESLVCMSRADQLFSLIQTQPAVSLNLTKYVLEQREVALNVMEDIAFLRVPDRIVRLFERLATEHGVPSGDGIKIAVRLRHADIASLVGSTRETVSLELMKLLKSGRLQTDGKSFVLPATLAAPSDP